MLIWNRREVLRRLVCAPSALWVTQYAALQGQGALQLQPLAPKLTLLSGAGGNIAILQGADGLLLVDSGLAEMTDTVLSQAKTVSSTPIRVLINTHFHYDHVGGNERLGREGVKIIAHENVLKRVSTLQHNAFLGRDSAPLAVEGRPKTTFREGGSLAHGPEKLTYVHLPPAHTDGDSTIHFQNANVFHAGDLYFSGTYPFIDYSAGGSIEGMIASADAMLKAVDGQTKIIPGHGPLSTRGDLQAYRDMLAAVNDKVSELVKSGKSVDQVLAAGPTKDYDAKWGNGFLKPADFVRMLMSGKAS